MQDVVRMQIQMYKPFTLRFCKGVYSLILVKDPLHPRELKALSSGLFRKANPASSPRDWNSYEIDAIISGTYKPAPARALLRLAKEFLPNPELPGTVIAHKVRQRYVPCAHGRELQLVAHRGIFEKIRVESNRIRCPGDTLVLVRCTD
jgi:hypothetical protein